MANVIEDIKSGIQFDDGDFVNLKNRGCVNNNHNSEKSIVYVSMENSNETKCSYAIISKEEKSVIIIFKDLECVIYDYDLLLTDDFNYKYLLLKHYKDTTLAYKDFLKLIGKMCKKSIESKYFENHLEEDNWMVVDDDINEHMIVDEEKDEYLRRRNLLNEFVKNNKDKFIKE